MQRHNIRANTKANLLKRLCFSFLVPVMLICLSAMFGSTSVSAQKLTAKIIACNESAQARYECYIKVQKDSQALAEKRMSSLNAQKKLRQSLYLKNLKKIDEALKKSKAKAGDRASTIDSQKKILQEAYFNKLEKAKAIAATRKSNLDSQKIRRQEDYYKGQERQGSMENAKELGATRKSILEEKEKLRLELSENIGKQLEKEHQEIMQQVEYSRSRNISHKGEKYSITYGYVPELGP